MRHARTGTRTDEQKFPVFDIGPILMHYGGEEPTEGRHWHAYKCPFHGDRTASASLSMQENIFNCHSCEMKGNAVQLIMLKEGINYANALKRAEEIAGASDASVSGASARSRRLSGGSRNQSGVRAFKRTWRSS